MFNYVICKTQAPLNFSLTFLIITNLEIHEICDLTKISRFGLILYLFRISGHWRLMHSQDKAPWFGYHPSSVPISDIHPNPVQVLSKTFKGTSIANRPRVC